MPDPPGAAGLRWTAPLWRVTGGRARARPSRLPRPGSTLTCQDGPAGRGAGMFVGGCRRVVPGDIPSHPARGPASRTARAEGDVESSMVEGGDPSGGCGIRLKLECSARADVLRSTDHARPGRVGGWPWPRVVHPSRCQPTAFETRVPRPPHRAAGAANRTRASSAVSRILQVVVSCPGGSNPILIPGRRAARGGVGEAPPPHLIACLGGAVEESWSRAPVPEELSGPRGEGGGRFLETSYRSPRGLSP